MQRQIILFLAADPPIPADPDRIRAAVGQQARAVRTELERSGHRDCFEFETRLAATPLDLLRELRKLKPTVVHFCGQGSENGLYFQNDEGKAQLVSAEALQDAFAAAGGSVKLAVLNACYSEPQAEALLAHVGCVVGVSGAIGPASAKNFAIGFYGGLGERESVAAAFQQGRAAISLEGLPDKDRPQLKVRAGVDASRLVLAGDPR